MQFLLDVDYRLRNNLNYTPIASGFKVEEKLFWAVSEQES
jgi:hypothetical protein